MRAPVALFIFRRPDTTAQVLDAIRRARPALLLVVADGPRADRPEDEAACAAARALIDTVDWPCEVRREFSRTNMGCRRRVASGLAWVFSQVPEAIILEDDCVPDATFFRFCDDLLDRYRDDRRVMQISGANNQKGQRRGDCSYFFSRYNNVWGWATWRRAFELYDSDIPEWPALRGSNWLATVLDDPGQVAFWTGEFQAIYEGRLDTWDYQWVLATWRHGMLSLVPNRNLVRNVGFGSDATHTPAHDRFADDLAVAMEFPLVHPSDVVADRAADRFTEQFEFTEPLSRRVWRSLRTRILRLIKRRLRVALGRPQWHTYPGVTIELPPDHLLPAYQRQFPLYDRFLPHLVAYLDAGDIVIDVGANCGDTLAAIASVNPALTFVCIEPDSTFFPFLERNAARIRAVHPEASIVPVRALVGTGSAAATLAGRGGTKHAQPADGARAPGDGELHRPVRLDDIVRRHAGAGRIRLLKSDVDGYDFDVLESAGAMLDDDRPLLFFECYAETDEQRRAYIELFTRLDARGYRRFAFFDNYGTLFAKNVAGTDEAHRLLRDVWKKRAAPPEAFARHVDYVDVLAFRDGDAPLIERVLAEFRLA